MNINESLKKCSLCVRRCNVNREKNEVGFCNSTNTVKLARADLHFWEEPCISGENGSGAIFFSNCNLRCVFCQNSLISQEGRGQDISINRLSEIFIELQCKGANNINLVTPTHYVPQIIKALYIAKNKGLVVPIIYNTNGYDSMETIKALDGYIDVYLPDFKYVNNKYSLKYSKADGYIENIIPVIKEMINQVGIAKFNDKGIITKGVIIRHLMLPGLLFDSKKVIDLIYKNFGNVVYISIMNQYTPMYKSCDYSEINKPLNPKHYDSLIEYAVNLGVINGFIQEEGTSTTIYTPSFNNEGL